MVAGVTRVVALTDNPAYPQWIADARGNVVFARQGGGIGDAICIFGGIQRLKEIHPRLITHFLTIPKLAPLAAYHTAIDCVHTSADTLPEEAKVIHLEHPVRGLGIGRDQPPDMDLIRVFGRAMGVSKPCIPRLYLTQEERAWAREWVASNLPGNAPFLALTWRTAERYKDYLYTEDLYYRLRQSRRVLIIEHELDVPGPSTRGLSIRECAAVISVARMVVCGDTGPMHMAGALQVPLFVLYGSHAPLHRHLPYQVPSGYIVGPCPHGRTLCAEYPCVSRQEIPPCLRFPVEAAAQMILHTLAALPTQRSA